MSKGLLKVIILGIFLIFGSSYLMSQNSYDDYYLRQKMIATSDKILEFEEDIKENKNIDLKEYVVKDINYTNEISNFIYDISDSMFKTSRKFVKYLFKRLNYLVED